MAKFLYPLEDDFVEVCFDYNNGSTGSLYELPEQDSMVILHVTYEGKDVSSIVSYDKIEDYFWKNKEGLLV